MAAATAAVKTILRGRPEISSENPDYLVGITETLSYLTPEELGWITDPRDGIATRCRFLPTPADVFDLIREKREIKEKRDAERLRLDRFKTKPVFSTTRRIALTCPFPALEAAFGETHDLRQPFDILCDASRMLATRGRDAALTVLIRASK